MSYVRPNPRIPGFMSEFELQTLYQMARQYKSIVEIGSWMGRSTYALLSGCDGNVIAVDHFKGSAGEMETCHRAAKHLDIHSIFRKNTQDFNNLSVLRMDSIEASKLFKPKSVDMVLIDGDHNAVKADIEAWYPVCSKMFCGHDVFLEVVAKALKDLEIPYKNGADSFWFVEVENASHRRHGQHSN